MKFRNLTCHSLLAILATAPAFAITDTWDGGGADNNLSTGLNWLDDSAPTSNLTTTDLIFAGVVRTTPNVSVALSANSVTFNNTAAAFTLGGLGLTVGTGGIVNNDADLQIFNNTVSIGTATSTFNAANGGLYFNGALGLGAFTLNVNGAANTTLGAVNGTGTINKSGGGTLIFQPGTAHVFDLVQSAGTVQTLAGGPTEFNAGSAVQINGGTFAALDDLTLDGAAFTRGTGVFTLASGATLAVQNGGSFAFSGSQVFNAGQTISVTNGSQITSTSYIDLANGGVGPVSLMVDGAGSLLQSGSINDWGTAGNNANVDFSNSAIVTLNGGLRLAASGAGGGASVDVTSGAQVTTSSLAVGSSTAGAQATMYVSGAGSKLTVTGTGATTIGAATGAAQRLAIFNSGSFESGTGAVTIGATGILNADGNFLVNGDIIVNGIINRTLFPLTLTPGKNLTVQGGGDANLQSLTLLANSTATFTGAGTTYNASFLTSSSATSAININAGATATIAAGLSAMAGAVTVDGTGSQLVANGSVSNIGDDGQSATLTFRNNATGSLGISAGIYVDVPRFESVEASGVVNVESGADLTLNSMAIAFSGTNTTGVVTVTGAGSTIVQNLDQSYLFIGKASSGAGTLNVSNGGSFYSGSASIVIRPTGTLAITGAGSSFSASAPMTVQGQLSVGAGSIFNIPANKSLTVEAGGDATFSQSPVYQGSSTVAVDGTGSTLTINGSGLTLGNNTTLNITNGAVATLSNLILNSTGTANLNGGTLNLGAPIVRNGGVLNFTAGALSLNENFTVGSTGLFGGNLTLAANRQLIVPTSATTTIEAFQTLTLDGGTLTTGTLANSGTIDFKKGTLGITGAGGFNVGTGALGSSVALAIGANLSVTNTTTIANGALLRLNGGSFSGNAIVNNGTIDHRDGALNFTGQMTATAGSRLFVGGLSTASGTISNAGTITLQNGIGFLGGAGAITNTGIITGDGMIAKPVTNSAGGQLRAEAGKTLFFTGAIAANAGTFSLEGGTLEFITAITNSASGVINGSGKLRSALLTNNGNIGLSGDSNFYGDVTNAAGARIITSGGATTTFFDDVIHNGTEIRTSGNSASLFFGAVSGPGPYTGSGIVYFEGDLRPGSSPAAVPFAPQVIFASSNALTMEIGGLNAGTQHDKLTFTYAGAPQVEWGGSLTVTLINGFVPTVGQSFDIFDFDAARDLGAFSSITLPALTAGLAWDTSQLYTTGTLTVIPAGLSFSQWATASGIPGALPTGDHDSDGTSNAVEFALGLFPSQLGTVEPIIELHNYVDGQRLRARFTRPLDRTGVTLIVQGSDDLVTWQDLATSVNSDPFTGSGFFSENRAHPLDEPGLVEVRDLFTTSNEPRRWMRISVTLAP